MKRNTPRHTKTRNLSKLLDIPRCTAVGLLELLWHATAQLAPRGDIGQLSNDHIAEELFWDGDPDALIEALCTAKWLDRCTNHRLVVHDWEDHCDQTVKRTKPVEDQGFAAAQIPTSSELVSNSSETSLPGTAAGNHKPLPGTVIRKPPAPRGAKYIALAAWPEIREAAAEYGRTWRGEKPSAARLKLLAARINELEPQIIPEVHLLWAVHGYVAFHRIVDPAYEFDKYFTPEVVFSPSKFEKYVEAYDNAVRSGLSPPFQRVEKESPKSFAQQQEDEMFRGLGLLDGGNNGSRDDGPDGITASRPVYRLPNG